ncbi:MAG: toprim domain-containing protein [Methylococcales bacterium]|nr:toprim domain-containing protein [Methylococcaceae bacterium]
MNTTYQIIDAFSAAMLEAGIQPPNNIVADGSLKRFHIAGHKIGSLNGAYKLNLEGLKPAGYFEDFKSGIKANWKADGPIKTLTPAERQQHAAARQQRQQEQDQRHQQAANAAQRLLDIAKPFIGNNHPYLLKKRVDSHGLYLLKIWPKRIKNDVGQWQSVVVKNVLLVPLIDINGKLWNLQAIFPEPSQELGRDKDFLAGGRLGGLFHVIGKATDAVIICEGYATGASLHTSTEMQVFCAMSAGNLQAVAQAIRNADRNKKIIICADNDEKTPGNPGLTAARKAAQCVGGALAVPPIAGDFNDYANMEVLQ